MTSDAPELDGSTEDRYAALELADDLVIYDREESNAWLQSDVALDLTA